ncbi:unnamed protein product [Brachionus calyciflorus]|uniref:Uncharacterized protein n=1 Tax=Brachionus calyciflorus TaxID=104777 RepID=A0A813UUP1_9BILA|nr:unnamed protein product [Brachionus calyciflorus]
MTNLLQPADVCWFASIKKEYHNKWNKWFLQDDEDLLPGLISVILKLMRALVCTIIADYMDELDEVDEIDGFDTDPNLFFEIRKQSSYSYEIEQKRNHNDIKKLLIDHPAFKSTNKLEILGKKYGVPSFTA